MRIAHVCRWGWGRRCGWWGGTIESALHGEHCHSAARPLWCDSTTTPTPPPTTTTTARAAAATTTTITPATTFTTANPHSSSWTTPSKPWPVRSTGSGCRLKPSQGGGTVSSLLARAATAAAAATTRGPSPPTTTITLRLQLLQLQPVTTLDSPLTLGCRWDRRATRLCRPLSRSCTSTCSETTRTPCYSALPAAASRHVALEWQRRRWSWWWGWGFVDEGGGRADCMGGREGEPRYRKKQTGKEKARDEREWETERDYCCPYVAFLCRIGSARVMMMCIHPMCGQARFNSVFIFTCASPPVHVHVHVDVWSRSTRRTGSRGKLPTCAPTSATSSRTSVATACCCATLMNTSTMTPTCRRVCG